MSDVAIKVEGLSKVYRIAASRPAYSLLTETIVQAARRSLGYLTRLATRRDDLNPESREVWALRDVSFEIPRGQVLGVIGRNGAGKSTLLKILARITPPTSGTAIIEGRVGSLLEVGTGFHPELTGRENIFLSGAVLGMRRAEVRRRFDEIVAFAETERFLDTPVKHYSSGMYMRLAFAVAAHLDPEVLLLDEILAVGDAAFQRKCLGTMDRVAKSGRTVLFVSHNLWAIGATCDSALVLSSGAIDYLGPVHRGIEHYLTQMGSRCAVVKLTPRPEAEIRFCSISLQDEGGRTTDVFAGDSPIHVVLEYEVPRRLQRVQILCHVWNMRGVHVLSTGDIDRSPALLEVREPGRYRAEFSLPGNLLAPGSFRLQVACGVPNLHLIDDQDGPVFEVTAENSYAAGWSEFRRDSVVAMPLEWVTRAVGEVPGGDS